MKAALGTRPPFKLRRLEAAGRFEMRGMEIPLPVSVHRSALAS